MWLVGIKGNRFVPMSYNCFKINSVISPEILYGVLCYIVMIMTLKFKVIQGLFSSLDKWRIYSREPFICQNLALHFLGSTVNANVFLKCGVDPL